MRKGARHGRHGFTLVEMVVTVGIVAALAAVVYPTVVKQFDSADPARAAEDLNNIRTGIETFGVNVRPNQPNDIEDLVNPIRSTLANGDTNALGAAYSVADSANWNGPYIGISIPTSTLTSSTAIGTGFEATIRSRLPLYDVDVGTTGGDSVAYASMANADFVAILIVGLSGTAFNAINDLIDGAAENTAVLRRHTGRVRCPGAAAPNDTDACTAAYYLASPLRK